MDDFNPYAAPEFSASNDHPLSTPDEGRGVWRDGDVLVMAKIARLPARCLKCNEPATNRLRRTLYYYPAWCYFLILLNLLIFIIVAMILRKSAAVELPLCQDHRDRRGRAILVAWMIGLGGLAACFTPAILGDQHMYMIVVGLIVLVVGLVYGSIHAQVVTPQKIDDRHAWLRNVSPFYLAQLPPLPSPYGDATGKARTEAEL